MGPREARYVNIVLGSWLFVSAFLWPHAGAQLTNTWMAGFITVVVASIGLHSSSARFLNTTLGIWIVVSALLLPFRSLGTMWNNVLVGLGIFFVSLIGRSTGPIRTEGSV
jgi:nitric oxide reductase large subunit